jgi:hypothetical protein
MELQDWQALVGRPEWRLLKQYWTDQREELKERMAQGEFTSDDMREGIILYNNAVAQCQMYETMLELDFDTIDSFYHVPEAESFEGTTAEENDDGSTDVS